MPTPSRSKQMKQMLLVAGPYDDARAIIAKLASKCGPDGFHYIAPIDPGEMPGIEQMFNTLEDDKGYEDEDDEE